MGFMKEKGLLYTRIFFAFTVFFMYFLWFSPQCFKASISHEYNTETPNSTKKSQNMESMEKRKHCFNKIYSYTTLFGLVLLFFTSTNRDKYQLSENMVVHSTVKSIWSGSDKVCLLMNIVPLIILPLLCCNVMFSCAVHWHIIVPFVAKSLSLASFSHASLRQ